MSSFEYVMVIVSIILGLGIATLLRGAIQAIRANSGSTLGGLHGLWVAILLLQYVQLWSARWYGGGREDWPALVLLAYLLVPIIYFAQAELLFPSARQAVDLDDYFLDNRVPFFGLAAAGHIATAAGRMLFYDPSSPMWITGRIAVIVVGLLSVYAAVCVALMWTRKRVMHLAWAVLYLLILIAQLQALAVG